MDLMFFRTTLLDPPRAGISPRIVFPLYISLTVASMPGARCAASLCTLDRQLLAPAQQQKGRNETF